MKIKFHEPYIGSTGERYNVTWPEGWPVPRKGEAVYPKEGTPLYVRHVCWYPHSVADQGLPDPFVYVVLGERPPT